MKHFGELREIEGHVNGYGEDVTLVWFSDGGYTTHGGTGMTAPFWNRDLDLKGEITTFTKVRLTGKIVGELYDPHTEEITHVGVFLEKAGGSPAELEPQGRTIWVPASQAIAVQEMISHD